MNHLASLLILTSVTGQIAADPFDQTVAALRREHAAEKRHDAKRMAQAISVLDALGAHADDGTQGVVASARTAGKAYSAPRPAFRNRVLGPGYRLVILPSGGSARFDQTFFAGQRARIAVVPLERSGFGLAVRDDDGPVCTFDASAAGCDWIPVSTSRVRIEIKNRASAAASFYLVVR